MNNSLGYIQQGSDLDVMYLDDNQIAEVMEGLGRIAKEDPRKLKKYLSQARLVHRGKGYVAAFNDYETKNLSGKALLERRMHLLPKEIREALHNGQLSITDYVIYGIVDGNDKNAFSIISNAQSKQLGTTNIGNGKLPSNTAFLLMSISLQEAVYDSTNDKYGDFDLLSEDSRKGEWTLKIGNKPVFDGQPTEMFYRPEVKGIKGEWKLENPKLIMPQTDIDFSVNFTANTKNRFRVILRGVATI